MSFNKLLLKVGKLPPQRLVVVSADDSSVIKTIVRAKNSGFVLPILIGNIKGIEEKLLKLKTDLNDYQLIEAASPEDAAFLAVELIRNNKADLLMKGLIETRILLKAVVNSETGIKKEKLLSHVAVFTYPVIEGFLLASDCAMVINPDLEQKKGLVENAVSVAKSIGIKTPKVAVISASEKVNPKLISSVDAASLKAFYAEQKEFILDGPFALDNVISYAAANLKGLDSSVAGKADVLIFPCLDAGNLFYKASVFLAQAEVAGIVVGAKCPIILTSRSDSCKSKLNSIALAMVHNHGL